MNGFAIDADGVVETMDAVSEHPDIKHYAHIVSPPENVEIFVHLSALIKSPSAKDIVDYARVVGLEVVALCGYKWVPSMNPDDLDACPICMDVAGMHMRNAGE